MERRLTAILAADVVGHLADLEAISSGVNLKRVRRGQHSIDPHRIEVLIEGMRMAGMREG